MPLSTYGELKTAIADWLQRSDMTTAQVADLVTLVETDISNDVRAQAMEAYSTGTLSGETLDHPTRFLEARRFVVEDYALEYVTPEVYQSHDRNGTTAKVYTSIGQKFYVNGGASGDDYTLIYYAGFAPFSASSDYNWLLTNAPDVYLYGACAHGSQYFMDEANVQRFKALYLGAVSRVNSREKSARVSGARLFVRPSTWE